VPLAVPDTRYAKSGNVNIAHQVFGDGPVDLVYVPGWVSHVELAWELPDLAAGFERLGSFARVILFDKRGTGMSDPVPPDELPTLEQRMDDVRAVMDAVGSERAAVFGASEGGNMSMLFAATYPERTVALATFGCTAKRVWSPTTRGRPPPSSDRRRSITSSVSGPPESTGRTSLRASMRGRWPRSPATTAAARAPEPR
jgi:pimeloyl-ACP methyl ester carboxylesterase